MQYVSMGEHAWNGAVMIGGYAVSQTSTFEEAYPLISDRCQSVIQTGTMQNKKCVHQR